MELKQARGNTWYLEGLELLPLYRIDPIHCIFLDTGLQHERDSLLESLEAYGLQPVGILSSHAHRDHSINNNALRQKYGAQLAMSPAEAALSQSLLMFKASYDPFSLQDLERYYGDMICEMDVVLPSQEGKTTFCGVEFEIRNTPGHSPGHISVITPDGVCYLADALLGGAPLERARLPYHYAYGPAIEQMKRIRDWNYPLYMVAHKLITTEIVPLVDRNLEILQQSFDDFLALLTRPMTRDEILFNLLIQRKLVTHQEEKAALFERNVQYMLEYLGSTGQVTLTLEHGLRRWESAK